VHGITWFIERVLPTVRRRVPEAELWLVGGIGRQIQTAAPGVRRFGFIERLDEVYRQAAAVINPQQFGTGLSIKSVDALLHGRPLVTTASGSRGLEQGAGVAFRQASDGEEFAAHLVELLQDPAGAAVLAGRAVAFARTYRERSLRALADVVRARAGSAP
jgi:glycosyltransferase involved in cell wall biosynthesis